MPSVLNYTDCPSCGHRHHFCLLTGTITARESYDFICPENGKVTTVVPARGGELARYAPQGAVQLTPLAAWRTAA